PADERGIRGGAERAGQRGEVGRERAELRPPGAAGAAAFEVRARGRRNRLREHVVRQILALHHLEKAAAAALWLGILFLNLHRRFQLLERVVEPRAERDLAVAGDLRDRAVVQIVEEAQRDHLALGQG